MKQEKNIEISILSFLVILGIILIILAMRFVREYHSGYIGDIGFLIFGTILLFGSTKILKFETQSLIILFITIFLWFDSYMILFNFLWRDALNYGSKINLDGVYMFILVILLGLFIIRFLYKEKWWKTIIVGLSVAFGSLILSLISWLIIVRPI